MNRNKQHLACAAPQLSMQYSTTKSCCTSSHPRLSAITGPTTAILNSDLKYHNRVAPKVFKWSHRSTTCRAPAFRTHVSAICNGKLDQYRLADLLDQYYTHPLIAAYLYFSVFCRYFYLAEHLMIEPCDGEGAFGTLLPRGSPRLDKDPKARGIMQADFLEFKFPEGRNIAVIGNPPFGRACKTAIKFFNYAATAANIIAFIVPLTFRKVSIQNQLNLEFHLEHEIELPKNSFIFKGKPYDVPAVFQIWVRREEPRAKIKVELTHPDFVFTDAKSADFVIQRIGANAGRIHHNRNAKKSSHYFIKGNDFIKGNVEHIMAQLDLATAAANVAGNPSLSKGEIVALYRAYCAAKK